MQVRNYAVRLRCSHCPVTTTILVTLLYSCRILSIVLVSTARNQAEHGVNSVRILRRFLEWVDDNRAKKAVRILKPHLHGAVLDVGCWNGHVASLLDQESIVGIDVADPPLPLIPVKKFDGIHIPFADDEFDTVLCCTALHHAKEQEQLLQEMMRVGRRVVILEDACNNLLERSSVILLHAIGSRLAGIPYRRSGFRTDGEWQAMFSELGLALRHSETHPGVQPLWLFLRHQLYILETTQPRIRNA